MTIQEVADLLNVGYTTVRSLIDKGYLHAIRLTAPRAARMPGKPEYSITIRDVLEMIDAANQGRRLLTRDVMEKGMLKTSDIDRWLNVLRGTTARNCKKGFLDGVQLPDGDFLVPKVWLEENLGLKEKGISFGEGQLLRRRDIEKITGLRRKAVIERVKTGEIQAIKLPGNENTTEYRFVAPTEPIQRKPGGFAALPKTIVTRIASSGGRAPRKKKDDKRK